MRDVRQQPWVDGLTLSLEDAMAHEPCSDDTDRIQPTISNSAPRRGRRFVTWFLRQFFIAAVLFYAATVLLPAFLEHVPERAVQFNGPLGWLRFVLPLLWGLAWALWQVKRRRDHLRWGSAAIAERMEAEYRELSQTGWVYRVLRMGLLIGLGVGLPVGALVAALSKASDLPHSSRILMFIVFLSLTFAWTFPMAFVIRWAALRLYRKHRRPIAA